MEATQSGINKLSQGILRPSPAANFWIRLREGILNRVSGARPEHVLNPIPAGNPAGINEHLAGELRKALSSISAAAIAADGVHVDYTTLRDSPAYADYRTHCSANLRWFDPSRLGSQAVRRAFWINLYNSLVLDAVISFSVRSSVTESRLGIFTFFRRAAYNINGLRVSLDDIEHGILRGNRGHPYLPGEHFTSDDPRLAWAIDLDPRIHFSLNCASRSCQRIQYYTAENLDAELDLAARTFIQNSVCIDHQREVLEISSILRWYEADFGGKGAVVDLLIATLPQDERREWLIEHRSRLLIEYAKYDWSLNN